VLSITNALNARCESSAVRIVLILSRFAFSLSLPKVGSIIFNAEYIPSAESMVFAFSKGFIAVRTWPLICCFFLSDKEVSKLPITLLCNSTTIFVLSWSVPVFHSCVSAMAAIDFCSFSLSSFDNALIALTYVLVYWETIESLAEPLFSDEFLMKSLASPSIFSWFDTSILFCL